MSLLHSISAFARGGVSGLQVTQPDWSPYVVHFTSYKSMQPLSRALDKGHSPTKISKHLKRADEESMAVVREIAADFRLKASSPAEKDGIPPCVCMTECVIDGLISHAERYGRFGLVFRKSDVFQLGGGPCLYLSPDEYAEIAKAFRQSSVQAQARIFGRANVFSPVGAGGKIQDYTHEREWRVFADISLADTPPRFVIAPEQFLPQCRDMFQNAVSIIPINTLFEWGA